MNDAATLRALEEQRLRALVAVDMATAGPLHAENFQLINPMGVSLSKDDYLGALESGRIHYQVFAPISDITVHCTGDLAALRYQSRIQITVDGVTGPEGTYWHTDIYIRREGRWQVIWSQATYAQP